MSTTNHIIPLEQAVAMTNLFRTNKPSTLPYYETFDKDAILQLLNTEDAKYLRVYYGMTEDLQTHAILVAADENEQDLLPSETNAVDKPVIIEDAIRCPPYCPSTSPLSQNQ